MYGIQEEKHRAEVADEGREGLVLANDHLRRVKGAEVVHGGCQVIKTVDDQRDLVEIRGRFKG